MGRPVPHGVEAYPPPQRLPVPSLHMWGLADDHVPSSASESLTEYFESPTIHTHPGAHFVPQKADDVAAWERFLKQLSAPDNAMGAPQLAHAKPFLPSQVLPCNDAAVTGPIALTCDELSRAVQGYIVAGGKAADTDPVAMVPVLCSGAGFAVGGATALEYLPVELEPPGIGTHERLLALVREKGANFGALGPHAPCRTSEDAVRVRLSGGWQGVTLHSGAKAMLMKTAKGAWLLCVVPADCKLSWKKVRLMHGKGTRMATEEEVRDIAGCVPGAVPPIAKAFPVATECLADLSLPDVINFNCGLRTRSMQMTRADYELVESPQLADIIE